MLDEKKNRKGHNRMKRFLACVLSLALLLGTMPSAAFTARAAEGTAASSAADLKIAVISDDHLYDTSLGTEGEAFESYLASDRKLLEASEEILDAALAEIAASDVDYLLISGDLTKDGEIVNHKLLAEKLTAFEAETGKQVYVINGNHDISNDDAVKYTASGTEKVESATTDDFREIYAAFGYDEAIAQDTNSLSYAVDLGSDYRLIVIDSCIYNDEDSFDTRSQETGGEISAEEMEWILGQIRQAYADGKQPIGMMHHGLVAHTEYQPTFFPEYLVNDYEEVADQFAQAGLDLVFTGHFHSLDAACTTTKSGAVMNDIETGSLVTSPCPIRYVDFYGTTVSYQTAYVTSTANHKDDFTSYAQDFINTGMLSLVEQFLPSVISGATGLDETMASMITAYEIADGVTVESLLADALIAHYAGDEVMPEQVQQICATLLSDTDSPYYQLYALLANVITSIYTDTELADAAGTISLSGEPATQGTAGTDAEETSVTKGNVTYTICSGGAAVTGVSKKTAKSLTIQAKVTIGGSSYPVVKIANGALKGCTGLTKIKIKSTSLRKVGKNAIKRVNKKAVIQVPKKKLSAYKKIIAKSSTGWKDTMEICGY